MGFSDRFPRWASALIAIAQLAAAAALVGLEFGSVYIDLAHGTIWVGFWAGIICFITSMVSFCFTCCCHNRYYGCYALVWASISLVLGAVAIYFSQHFVNNLCTCYLGNTLCCAVRGIPDFNSNYSNVVDTCNRQLAAGASGITCPKTPHGKLGYLYGMIAAGCVMLISSFIYILLFILGACGICFRGK